jgi:hypothetical protein
MGLDSVADRIREPVLFDPWIRETEWVKIKVRDEHLGSYFIFFGFKILSFFDADRNPFDPGSGIRNEKFGSGINIPKP